MKNILQSFVIKYYKFVKSMNRILKFNELVQYKNINNMKLGVYMNYTAKL